MTTFRALLPFGVLALVPACLDDVAQDELVLDEAASTGELGRLSVRCTGTQTASFQPGLLIQPQLVGAAISSTLRSCTSTDPTLTAGAVSSLAIGIYACLGLGGATGVPATIEWNNGTSSTFSYDSITTHLGALTFITAIGTITDGPFTGRAAIETSHGIAVEPVSCLEPPGIESISGATTLTIF
jgi:hypothetical protein